MSNGDTRTRSRWATGILLLAALLFGQSAWAADPDPGAGGVISINFTALGDAAAVLGSADVAGVIPRANWNNYAYNSSTYTLTPVDDTGASVAGAQVNYRINTGYQGNHSFTPTVGNDRMMKYYCGNDEGPPTDVTRTLIRVSGLPASFLAGYSIYVYSDWHNDNAILRKIYLGTSILDINNQSAGMATTNTNETLTDSTHWRQPETNTNFTQAVSGSVGNYIVFTNQTASEFALFPSANAPTRCAINGIQIVQESTKPTGGVLIVR